MNTDSLYRTLFQRNIEYNEKQEDSASDGNICYSKEGLV